MKKYDENVIGTARCVLDEAEAKFLSDRAARSVEAFRRAPEKHRDTDYRQAFAIDVDRILHAHAYARYIDKTQVFYLVQNDHITHRVLHVQLVSKIARTIGRYLGLNEDLIEAIALGHDIGHAPFGHDGERYLSKLCQDREIGAFQHNVQSVQFLDKVERKGLGWNLCLQTLDGILCHDGEVHNQLLKPVSEKDFNVLDDEMQRKIKDPATGLVPMTLEGCVVRIADTIAYIGRDIEDAIRLKLINRSDLPRASVEILGSTNGTIVFNLVTDIIQNSFQKDYVAFSADVSQALQRLKKFNLERIYLNPAIKAHSAKLETLFGFLFEKYLSDLKHRDLTSVIFRQFLNGMSAAYTQDHSDAEIVRDFIAGMTDAYFLSQCPREMRPSVRRM
ncbi:MAG: HD domain-containing protein [Desulfobacterales bacterium]|nr:HD domain-containing protein [Desulfobacterales bacterium]